jgi:AcrR family transcriptional regulator
VTSTAPGRTKAEQSAATKARLFDAAVEEFQAHGLAGGRVDRIAARAGANKRLIYIYFGDKEDLFKAVVVRDVETMIDVVPITPDDLAGYAVSLFDYLEAHPTVSRLLAWRNLERIDASEAEADAYRRKVEAVAQAQTVLAPGSAHGPADVLTFILGLVQSWTNASPALRGLAGADEAARTQQRRRSLHEAVTRLTTPREA